MISRREFCKRAAAGFAVGGLGKVALCRDEEAFRFRYIVASSMYGRLKLDEILPEVAKTGAEHIDIWPEQHANQREQIQRIGHEKFAAKLKQHRVKLGILTHYDLGPFDLQNEMRVAKMLGGSMVICGSRGPKKLKGQELKEAVRGFVEKMKPHSRCAEETGITIGIENHANSLIESPDSMRWLAELALSQHIGIALAPYHLPQEPLLTAGLIEDLGERLVHFYAWQYGQGCHRKLPIEQQLLQMPGRGKLDFEPIVAALKKIKYKGWTEIFMHPVPRGVPILPTAAQVTDEINRSRQYLEKCLDGLS